MVDAFLTRSRRSKKDSENKSQSVDVKISGAGILHVDSHELIQSEKVRKQLDALGDIKLTTNKNK